MKIHEKPDVDDDIQMALGSPTNGDGEALSSQATLTCSQLPIDSGVVNSAYVEDEEELVDSCFVDIRSECGPEERINCDRRGVGDCEWTSHFERRYALGISPPVVGQRRIYPRRLWFERRHWGSDLPRDVVRGPFDTVRFLPRREEVGQATGTRSSASSSKVVYSIGVFYSDTDLCKRPAGHVSGKVTAGGMTSSPAGESIPPRRPSGRSARRPAAAHTQLTPDAFPSDGAAPDSGGGNALPDILNSHLPPPYSTLPPERGGGGRRLPPPSHPPPPPPPATAAPRRTPRGGGRGAFRSAFHPRERGGGRRGFGGGAPAASESDEPKHCCGVMVTQTVSIRWFIVMIAFVGLCCAIVGTVLGALKATGREHLTVSLLMIGVGIVLITVSGIAWRLTSHDAPSCRAMLGLQNSEQEPNRRFVPRVPPYGRPHHPYAAMMYPEFQYRPPPPSYQASMQEYRLRLLLLDRQQGSGAASNTASALSPVSPPPTYRSHTTGTLHSRTPLTLTEREYSRPPSYRSRASSAGVLRPSTETLCSLTTPPPQQPQPLATSHSRNPSLSLSFLSHESLFLDSGHSRPAAHFTSPSGDSVVAGLSDDSPPSRDGGSTWGRAPSWKPHHHDINAVTIVQTTDSSQVLNRDAVILSVPARDPDLGNASAASGEVRILAHV